MFWLGAIPYEGVGGFVGGSLLCLPTPNVLKQSPFFFFFAGMGGCGLRLLSRNGWFIYFNCVLQFGLFPKHVFCSLVHLTSLKLFSNCFGS